MMTRDGRALVLAAALIIVATGTLLFVQRLRMPEPPSAPSVDLGLGQAIYQQYCAVCHGPSGEGKPPAPPMNYRGHAHHHPDWELLMVIEQGRTGLGQMPAWKGQLSDREITAVIAYIKTLWDEDQRAFQERVNELRPTPP
jgi:mono/diheme cytochrome c family protein